MEIPFDFITLIHLAAVVLGIVSAAIILFYGFKTHPVNLPLGIGQLSISLGVFVSFSLVSKLIVHWPFLYRTGNIFALVFVPMPYLYTVFYTRKRLWRWYDLLHALPLLIFLVDYWDVLSMSSAQKLILIQQEVNDLDVLGAFKQSKFFGPGFHQGFRTVLFSAYWVAQVMVLVKWVRSQPSLTPQSKVWRNWMMLFLGCQFFIWFPFYLSLFGLNIMTTYHIVNSFSVIWLMVSSLSLFFFPSLLYGKAVEGDGRRRITSRDPVQSQPTEAEKKKLEEIMEMIEYKMNESSYFLKQGYSIKDLSNDVGIPVYQISKSLNILRGLGFVDYINLKRIQYCISKYENGEWLHFTVEAIAEKCGFNNRNTFSKAFKRTKGISPSDFRATLVKAD